MASAPTPQELQELINLYQQVDNLTAQQAQLMANVATNAGNVNKEISRLKNELTSVNNTFGSIAQSLKDSIQEFSRLNTTASSTKKSFISLQSIASKLLHDQSGYAQLSEKELNRLKEKTTLEFQNLRINIASGKLSTDQRQEALDVGIRTVRLIRLLRERLELEKNITKNLGLTGKAYKGIQSTLQKLGVDSQVLDNMNEKLREAAEKGKVGFKKLFEVTKEGFKEAMEDPAFRFAVGMKLLTSAFNDIKKAFEIWKEFNAILVETSRNLGQSVEQVTKMAQGAKEVQGRFDGNVYTLKQTAQAISNINDELNLSVQISGETLNEFTAMTNQMGLTAAEASKIQKLGLLNNLSLKDTNKTIAAGIIATQKSTGVQISAKQVFQEIGKLSAGITAKFQQNPRLIAEAVAQAKALGTNLETIDKIGESLLNWESSIENELEAELITGRKINVEKARYAALTGDQLSLTKEIADQVGNLADFQNMNVIAQTSLAKAFGLSKDELAQMLQQQEVFNKLGDVSGKSAAEQLKIARERGLTETDSLVVNLQQQAATEKLAATWDSIKLALADILNGPFSGLVSMMGFFAKNSWAAYTALSLMGAISIAKLITGLITMATTLGISAIEALTLLSALTLGVGIAVAIAGMIAGKSAMESQSADLANNAPKFAKGGIVTGEIRNATIGEAGAEAIIPLNSPKADNILGGGNNNNAMAQTIGDKLDKHFQAIAGFVQRPAVIHGENAFVNNLGRNSNLGTAQNINTKYQLA